VVVLLPGLLFSRRMHRPLAETLADRGHRVLSLDLLGHGDSDRPPEMFNYGMQLFARQAVALLDHLEIERAVVGGTSLGANVALEVAALAPERAQGLLIEMPVLDNALLGCAIAFTPMLIGLTFGAPVVRLVGRAAGAVPRGSAHLVDMLLDWASQDPKPSASVLQGLFFGRVAPPSEERRRMDQHTLVIGHYRDPVHPFSDSDMLVRDDGTGFDASPPRDGLPHHGMTSMRERAQILGGRLRIDSVPGAGTELRVILPGRTRRLDIRFRSPADGRRRALLSGLDLLRRALAD